jgi:hypothetical protein
MAEKEFKIEKPKLHKDILLFRTIYKSLQRFRNQLKKKLCHVSTFCKL